jgi:hypothetical protein
MESKQQGATSKNPDKLLIEVHFWIELCSLWYDSEFWSLTKAPVPKSTNWGACAKIFWRESSGTAWFNLRLLRFRHLATSLSRAGKLTSPLRHAKFKEMSDVQLSGKQLSHWPLWSSTSFSCKSSSLRNLNQEERKKISVRNGLGHSCYWPRQYQSNPLDQTDFLR